MNATPLTTLWQRNPVLVRLLALSPLLAMTQSLTAALGLGVATMIVTTSGAPLLAVLRSRLSPELLIAASALWVSALVLCVDLLMEAFWFSLHHRLGLFLPLMAAFALPLVDSDARKPMAAALEGLTTGIGFLLALVLMASIREALAHGSWFSEVSLLSGGTHGGLRLLPEHYHFAFWALPAGGFIIAGFLLALHRRYTTTASRPPAVRARVTTAATPPATPPGTD